MSETQSSSDDPAASGERSKDIGKHSPGAAGPPKHRRASDPLVVAIFATAAAGFFNVVTSFYNSRSEQNLEALRDDNALIVEAIKTGPTQAKDNLLFLANNGLLSQTRADAIKNALNVKGSVAPSLAYGPDTCKSGFVWREATPTDHVCVTPTTRDQTALDNAAERVREVRGVDGAYTCKAGFVPREATPTDHVCVTEEVRARTAEDNRAGPERRVQGG